MTNKEDLKLPPRPTWTPARLAEFLGTEYDGCRIMIGWPESNRISGKALMPVETVEVRTNRDGDFIVVLSAAHIEQ